VSRSLFILYALLIINNPICIAQQSPDKLPKPSSEIKSDLTLEKGFVYLEANFKKQGQRKILQKFKDCENNCECSWQQAFRRGVDYSFDECAEAGYVVKITFNNYSKSDVINLVDELFKTRENSWNQEMSKYSPSAGEAGCSYVISVYKGAVVLEYYCGC
jgi:hypothetical protein